MTNKTCRSGRHQWELTRICTSTVTQSEDFTRSHWLVLACVILGLGLSSQAFFLSKPISGYLFDQPAERPSPVLCLEFRPKSERILVYGYYSCGQFTRERFSDVSIQGQKSCRKYIVPIYIYMDVLSNHFDLTFFKMYRTMEAFSHNVEISLKLVSDIWMIRSSIFSSSIKICIGSSASRSVVRQDSEDLPWPRETKAEF